VLFTSVLGSATTATDKLVRISFRGMSIESQDWNHPASQMSNNSAQFSIDV